LLENSIKIVIRLPFPLYTPENGSREDGWAYLKNRLLTESSLIFMENSIKVVLCLPPPLYTPDDGGREDGWVYLKMRLLKKVP